MRAREAAALWGYGARSSWPGQCHERAVGLRGRHGAEADLVDERSELVVGAVVPCWDHEVATAADRVGDVERGELARAPVARHVVDTATENERRSDRATLHRPPPAATGR